MSAATVLREARKLVTQRWTQGALALAPDGKSGRSSGRRAVCWCIYGAMMRAYDGMPVGELADAVTLIESAAGTDDLIPWNDWEGRTQADVFAAFSKAIELAEGVR